MIITSIIADNFRKYAHLQLDNLPDSGLIALTGGNESGKSSIGDAIQFGLFGCTDQVKSEEAAKLIHWGASHASVALRLQHRGHEYRLVRSVDSEGNVAATLFSTEEEITLADTPETVERQIKALFGYYYGAYSKAFYWGQQNSNMKDGDSDNLRAMAGLKEHANISEQLEREQKERINTLRELEARRQHTAQSIDTLHIDENQMSHLTKIVNDVEGRQQQLTLLGQRLNKESSAYPLNLEKFQGIDTHSQKIGKWTLITLLIFILALLTGLFFMFTPEWGNKLLSSLSITIRESLGKGAIRLASITALIGAILLVYGWYVEVRRLRPLQAQARHLTSALEESYQACTQPVSRSLATDSTDYLVEKHIDLPEVSTTHPDMAVVPEWIKTASQYKAKALYVHSAADILNAGLSNRSDELNEHLDVIKTDINAIQQQLDHQAKLQALVSQQETSLEQERRQQVVTTIAVDLLKQDASHSIERFNQLVKTHCPDLLQRFTQKHYKSLEISSDFSLKLLSEEKGDFLDFNEISTGTQRQVALAMRIALANALADATKTDKQMLFLDEPFAFFDPERTNNTLHSLAETSKGIVSQIWLTAQTKPEGIKLAQVINCQRGNTTLKA
ncbi:ATP-binding protein [Thiothrix lacustris]|uniref:ATP-binding protein n=1 Tax=Thiothrix lacustris TaxID=525917 RepID=UPI0027E3E107|nr:AAA family ATPase [Thiothrix lacustris]WMP16149.1 AAA family ATPase [Thiothrix lacustris]